MLSVSRFHASTVKKTKNKRDEASLCVTKELKQSPLLQLMCIVHMSSEPLF